MFLTIDVAHPRRSSAFVEEELLEALSRVRNSTDLRLLKVVHGYGSAGKGGTIREFVRNWSFLQKRRLKSVISGEEYTLHNPVVQEMRKEVGDFVDPDLGGLNPGITILWVK